MPLNTKKLLVFTAFYCSDGLVFTMDYASAKTKAVKILGKEASDKDLTDMIVDILKSDKPKEKKKAKAKPKSAPKSSRSTSHLLGDVGRLGLLYQKNPSLATDLRRQRFKNRKNPDRDKKWRVAEKEVTPATPVVPPV